ncbi:MAG: PAS domain-containing protein [Myxococcales bacterium]|nr:PAS domain-containing protein [Myxococcales bacterium]
MAGAEDPAAAAASDTLLARIERAKLEWEGTFDAIRDGIAVVAPDGRVRRVNRALAKMLAADVRALPGRACCEVWAHHVTLGCPLDEPALRPRVFDSPAMPGHQLEERAHALPDGGTVLLFEEVTEREAVRRNVERLHREAREANRALSESLQALQREQVRTAQAEGTASLASLAAGLAHEINNPLGIITQNLGHAEGDAKALEGLAERGDAAPNQAAALGAELLETLSDARAGAARIGRGGGSASRLRVGSAV